MDLIKDYELADSLKSCRLVVSCENCELIYLLCNELVHIGFQLTFPKFANTNIASYAKKQFSYHKLANFHVIRMLNISS